MRLLGACRSSGVALAPATTRVIVALVAAGGSATAGVASMLGSTGVEVDVCDACAAGLPSPVLEEMPPPARPSLVGKQTRAKKPLRPVGAAGGIQKRRKERVKSAAAGSLAAINRSETTDKAVIREVFAAAMALAHPDSPEMSARMSAQAMASATSHLVRRDARRVRASFVAAGVRVPTEMATDDARDEARALRAPKTSWLFDSSDPRFVDGATFDLTEAIQMYVQERDKDDRWMSDGRPLLLCLTNDGTNFGKAKKHSLQGGTFRILNQQDGTRSCDNTIIYSLARTTETKTDMCAVLARQERDVANLVADGIELHGRLHPVVCFLCSDEKGIALTMNLAGTSSSHPCSYCIITVDNMKKLEDKHGLRTTEHTKQMVEKLQEHATQLDPAWVEPFTERCAPTKVVYTRLQQFSSGTLGVATVKCRTKGCPLTSACQLGPCGLPDAVRRESQQNNCAGHLGTPKFFQNAICVPDAFHQNLHLIQMLYTLVEDVAAIGGAPMMKKLSDAMVAGEMAQIHIKGPGLSDKKADGQHRGFNGGEANGWLHVVMRHYILDVFEPAPRASLEEGMQLGGRYATAHRSQRYADVHQLERRSEPRARAAHRRVSRLGEDY